MCKRIFFIWVGLFLLAAPVSAQSHTLLSRQTDAYFSTVSALFLYEEEGASSFEETWNGTKEILSQIERAVSISDPDSDIARFNALSSGQSCTISSVTADILRTAYDVYAETDGLYDPTVYPLVDLWGFSPRFNRNTYSPALPYDRAYIDGRLPMPNERHIEALLPLVGLSGITLTEENGVYTLHKNTPPVTIDGELIQAQLDLGGIAKGYACDRVAEYLRQQGYTMGHFVCGGSSMAILSRPDGDGLYTITLGKPRAGAADITYYASVQVRDTTLSTSSDSLHSFIQDDTLYCHLIDPRTGWPVNTPAGDSGQRGIASLTLLGESAAYNDAMSTALIVMGPQKAMAYISEHMQNDSVVFAAYKAGETALEVVTNMPDSQLSLDDSAYLSASTVDADGHILYTGCFFAP